MGKKSQNSASHDERVADFLFELGTMRKLLRMHRQVLLSDDMSDNIASHSYRVALIGWLLAQEEGADPYRVVMMCLLHDVGETRSGDHNWLHKRYIKVFEGEIDEEQLGRLPYSELKQILDEYNERKTKEALVAKDADLLDQILLLREYEWAGNHEAARWLHGLDGNNEYRQVERLKLEKTRNIARAIYDKTPSDWWDGLQTPKNR